MMETASTEMFTRLFYLFLTQLAADSLLAEKFFFRHILAADVCSCSPSVLSLLNTKNMRPMTQKYIYGRKNEAE